MVTTKQAWIGLVALFLVALLIVVAAMYWHLMTGINLSHLLAGGGPGAGQGC